MRRPPEKELTRNIVYHAVSVITLAGTKETASKLRDLVISTLDDRLSKIVKLSMELNRLSQEKVTSGDVEATLIEPRSRFEPNAMEDARGSGESVSGKENIICTTSLGLKQYVKRGVGEEDEEETIKIKWDRTILLKPKVILSSSIV